MRTIKPLQDQSRINNSHNKVRYKYYGITKMLIAKYKPKRINHTLLKAIKTITIKEQLN